ncbi:MAG: FAD-dependent oxidoreductase [Aeromonas sp.]
MGAVYDPNGGQVHAMKLVNALRKAVEQTGVTIYEQSPVMGIKEGKQIELKVADKYKVTGDSTEAVGVMGDHKNIYNGHGINLSFLFGDVVATLYQGKEHPWFDHAKQSLPIWLPPEPFKSIGVKSVLKFYHWQDRDYLEP